MIKLETILENYKEWETPLDDRFGARLCYFLEPHQLEKIGFEYTGDEEEEIKEWNEANVLEQLKRDVEFGWEKACNHRGLSACLMVDVIQKWCDVLENGLHYDPEYSDYGMSFIQEVDQKYGWHLTDMDVAEDDYALKQWQQGMHMVKLDGEE